MTALHWLLVLLGRSAAPRPLHLERLTMTHTEELKMARDALALNADLDPQTPIVERLAKTRAALAAIDAIPQHDAQPNCHSTRPDVAPPSRPDDYCTDIQCRVMGRCRYAAPAADIDEAQLARLSERGAVAWAGVDAQALREGVPSGELAGMSADHGPDGWPAVQMRDISALCDEVARLRAALAAQVLQWLPMDSVPKDGRRVLVAIEGVDRAVVAMWNGGVWETVDGNCWTGRAITHWMPLPAAPGASPQPPQQGREGWGAPNDPDQRRASTSAASPCSADGAEAKGL